MTDAATTRAAPQSEAVMLTPVSKTPMEDAVVTVCKSPVGVHAGLSYRVDEEGARRHLHLEFHFRLKNDESLPTDALWVTPRLDEFALADVRASACLIARRHEDGRIPYALQRGASFATSGVLELNGSLGLTCATFLEQVFAHANVALLETSTWNVGRSSKRQVEDEAAQRLLVAFLRGRPGAANHADLVEKEIPCTRIRAEEVAAASGMTGHPIPFSRAEPEGARILAAVQVANNPIPPEVPRGPTQQETKRREVHASSVEPANEM